jgi:hypothetical protein
MYQCARCNCTSNNDVKSSCYFNSDFVCWRTFRAMPDWFYITFVCVCSVWLRHECCWHCCEICLHICTCTFTLWFKLCIPKQVSVSIQIYCWRVAWILGFGCSICRACNWFLFCDWCGTKWCWIMYQCVLCNCTSNDDVKSSCYFNSDFVCWRTFRTMLYKCLIGCT